jgi:hypothetical protein
MQRAAQLHHQLNREREELKQEINDLKRQLAEALDSHKGENKKVTFLELENLQLRNDIQTLQIDRNDKDRFMSLVRQVLDKFEVKAPERKPRKPRAGGGKGQKPVDIAVLEAANEAPQKD